MYCSTLEGNIGKLHLNGIDITDLLNSEILKGPLDKITLDLP